MHDRLGHRLAVGDHVLIPAIITATHLGATTCQLTLQTAETMTDDRDHGDLLSLNGRQVELDADAAVKEQRRGPEATGKPGEDAPGAARSGDDTAGEAARSAGGAVHAGAEADPARTSERAAAAEAEDTSADDEAKASD